MPDVVITDVALPGTEPFEPVRNIVRVRPNARVLILSTSTRAELAAESLVAGAAGFATRSDGSEELFAGVRAVASGTRYLSPRISPHAVDEILHTRRSSGDGTTARLEKLSTREREVFRMLVRGDGNRAIAERLRISVRTVETHRAHILRKLDLHSLGDMVRVAVDHGLFLSEPH